MAKSYYDDPYAAQAVDLDYDAQLNYMQYFDPYAPPPDTASGGGGGGIAGTIGGLAGTGAGTYGANSLYSAATGAAAAPAAATGASLATPAIPSLISATGTPAAAAAASGVPAMPSLISATATPAAAAAPALSATTGSIIAAIPSLLYALTPHLLGGDKSRAQKERDQVRGHWQGSGAVDDNYQMALPQGGYFNFGDDGSALPSVDLSNPDTKALYDKAAGMIGDITQHRSDNSGLQQLDRAAFAGALPGRNISDNEYLVGKQKALPFYDGVVQQFESSVDESLLPGFVSAAQQGAGSASDAASNLDKIFEQFGYKGKK